MLNWIIRKINYAIGYIKGMYEMAIFILRHPGMTKDELIYESFHEGLINADDIEKLIDMTHNEKES